MLVDSVFNDKYNFELSSGATIPLRELYYVDLKFTGGTNSLINNFHRCLLNVVISLYLV